MVEDGPNLVTPEGLAPIDAHIARIESALQSETNVLLRETLARDLRYWTIRKSTAEIVQPATDGTVAFGSTVTVKRKTREQTFRIVGVDEADPANGLISFRAPLAQAVLGARVGDVIEAKVVGRNGSGEKIRTSEIASLGRHNFAPFSVTTIGRFIRIGCCTIASSNAPSLEASVMPAAATVSFSFHRTTSRTGTPIFRDQRLKFGAGERGFEIFDDGGLDAALADEGEGVAGGGAFWVVVDCDGH